MTDSLKNIMTAGYLSKLSNMRIRIADRLNGGYNGERKSKNRGSSIEFSDFRDYTPGDDGSRIDWNSFGRLNRLYIKTYEEEKQAMINFFIDTSASMGFGSGGLYGFDKLSFAKLFVASAAYISLRNSDKINIIPFNIHDQEQSKSIAKRKNEKKDRLADLINYLDDLKVTDQYWHSGAKKQTDGLNSNKNLSLFQGLNLRQGASLVISDFMFPGGYKDEIKRLQNQKQEVMLIHVLAREEIDIEITDAPVRLIDSETGEFKELYLTDEMVKAYNASLASFFADIKEFCAKRGVSYRFAASDSDVLKLVASLN